MTVDQGTQRPVPDSASGSPPADDLPVHVFTIVLNGEPFIRYHEDMLRRLPFRWHWHVVEGVAALRHDTAWSTATGGRVHDGMHRQGRSNDGTSEYLDDLAARFPGQVTLYRKPPGEFWDGKREMVNAPLPSITEPCLLWQMDNDELWTVDQIVEMRRRFLAEPDRGAAFYWCWYYVGPDRIISTRHNYAQNPAFEWLRTWRYRPGDHWAAHEPPTLVRPQPGDARPVDIATMHPFTQDETESFGAVFQHFAYVTEAQLGFKEDYYGYRDARAQWRTLLGTRRPGFLADHFAWVTDRTMFDSAPLYRVAPLAAPDPATGAWRFAVPEGVKDREAVPVRPRILVDGVYWQYLDSGIGRVWRSLLEAWVADGTADHVILLDRGGTAPRIAGVHMFTIARHDYGRSGSDSLYLERICRDLGADLFVSTYYTTPTATPSLFFGHDMIPEACGLDLTEACWEEKARAIHHAAAHLMVSRNSARDLARFFPEVAEERVTVALNGLQPGFAPATAEEIGAGLAALRLPARYALMVGDRNGAGGYKNGVMAFQAVAAATRQGFALGLVCVGGLPEIDPAHRAAAPDVEIRRVAADDATLRLLYAGAHALLYPSRYEGFGMPVMEAMACGCPVVTCANSSLTEVGGTAAIYVDPDDPEGAVAALQDLADPARRAERVAAGIAQAARLRVDDQARIVMQAFRDAVAGLAAGSLPRPGKGWDNLRSYQARVEAMVQDRPEVAAAMRDAAGADAVAAAPARPSGELLRALAEIEAMKRSPFWRLRGKVLGVLRRLGLRHRG